MDNQSPCFFSFLSIIYFVVRYRKNIERGPVSVSGPVPSGPVVSGPVPSGPVVKFIIISPFKIVFIG